MRKFILAIVAAGIVGLLVGIVLAERRQQPLTSAGDNNLSPDLERQDARLRADLEQMRAAHFRHMHEQGYYDDLYESEG